MGLSEIPVVVIYDDAGRDLQRWHCAKICQTRQANHKSVHMRQARGPAPYVSPICQSAPDPVLDEGPDRESVDM